MSSLHQHAKDLFLEALARPLEERDTFLAEACGTDAELRLEVESLLAFHSDQASNGSQGDDSLAGIEASDLPFAAGEMFAGRYRMIARIGRGGMGDVWRADDLVLNTPVALKLIHLDGPDARDRIVNEVRLARQITHPAICRVFDVGESGGQVFLSMELVQGEDLATLLKRVGRLPTERVIEIGKQLCGGLAAAHAQNVLHRDLKPANVLIDDRGRVLITDFGIAVPRSDTRRHTLIGTPAYMAPEQMTDGAPLTERTDLYALGLVLYELLVGQHPFDRGLRRTDPQRPSRRLQNIPAALERTILSAISTNPLDRPVSAVAMAEGLESLDAPATGTRSWTWLAAVAVLAAAIGGLLTVASTLVPQMLPTLTAQDTIVLADFTNTTGEPVFDGALKVALAVSLEQSPFLRVFSDDRVRETLRLMGRSADEPVTRPIAREIAQRQELKALVAGSIARLGRNYVIAVEAINAQTGDAMARQQVEVTSKEEVLTALGTAVSQMRGTLGESLASVEKFDTPLPRATTSSLEALHAYSLALDHGVANPRPEAIPHLKRAIELDPEFAMALAFLATVYSNTGQTLLAPEFARRAFDLRERVSERERYFIAFRYQRDATQNWDAALDLTRAWTAAYPREAFAFNSLGTALLRFGRFEASLAPFREAIRLDPVLSAPYGNLATALIALNRLDEARATLQQAGDRNVQSSATRRLSYTLSFMANDAARMAEQWEAWSRTRDVTAYGVRAHALAFSGRVNAAHDDFRTGIQMAQQNGLNEVAAQLGVEDAEVHAIVGQCDAARRELTTALSSSRDNFTLERGSRAAALCRDEGVRGQLSSELSRRFSEATFTVSAALPVTVVAAAVSTGAAAVALERLDAMRPYELAPRVELWPSYLRALARLQLKDVTGAAAEFQAVIDRRSADPDSMLYALSHLGLARAAQMSGNPEWAKAVYDRFFGLWKDADRDLAPLVAARLERQRLP